MEEGKKYDTGKLRWDLLPIDCVEDVVKILTFGAEKYGPNNWQGVEEDRYYAALMRHLSASRQGQVNDEESGLSHMAHVMCNVVFLLWFEKHKSFVTPYIYRVTLGKDSKITDDGRYIICYKGEDLILDHNEFEFTSINKLSNMEFIDILDGTTGIKRIHGEFKDDV